MIAAIHQPNYFPWLGYFYKILHCDVFILLDDAQYTRNSYINRTQIKTPSGVQWLTIPVLHKSRLGQAIRQTEINVQDPSWKKQRKTLESCYRRSRAFEDFWPVAESILAQDWTDLASLNIDAIERVCEWLKIRTRLIRSSRLDCPGQRTARLVQLCKAVGADVYLSGSGGKKYQDEELFAEAGISLRYSPFRHPRYSQLWQDFVEGLSILDLLLNEGSKAKNILSSCTPVSASA